MKNLILINTKNKFQLFSNNILVAECGFGVEDSDKWFNENYMFIYNLRTIERFRRRGFAKYLLQKIFEYVLSKYKVNIITLIVDKNNYNAIELYNSVGFKLFIEYENSFSLFKKIS